jgi:enoyl-CoA hydratase
VTVVTFGLDQIAALAQAPGSAADFGPGATPWLLVDLTATNWPEMPTYRRWLRSLPCPVIGVGRAATREPADNDPMSACDTGVETAAQVRLLLRTIEQAPIAAMTFVQLLRTTEALPLRDALIAESLAYSTLQTGPEYQRWLQVNRTETPFAHSDKGPAVLVERDGASLCLTLNRPSNRNGMTVEMRDALCEALQLVQCDSTIEQTVIRGAGKCFSTGGDLTEFGSAPDPATAHWVRSVRLPGRELAACADRVEAQLHGACIGSGIEFPAFAGRVVADASTHFQLPELKFGLIPGAGGCVSIPRRIGRQRTAWWVLSGQRINARQAQDWGLIDAIV